VSSLSRDVVLSHPGKQHSYEVAVALERAGRLKCFYTGMFFRQGPYARAASRLLGKRSHAGVPSDRVRSWPYAEAVSRSLGRSRILPRAIRDRLQYPFVNWAFDRHVARQLVGLNPPPSAVYGFLGASEQTFVAAQRRGIATVLDVPIVLDALEVIKQENAVRGQFDTPTGLSHVRMRREIMTADWVVVPSKAVAQSVATVDTAHPGISIVPFGVDVDRFAPSARRNTVPGRLNVLFAGRLEPRKGVHFLIDAWRHAPADWNLELAGPAGPAQYVRSLRENYTTNVSELGNLTQSELAEFLRKGDVFVFPSLAEGSALVTYQALASGLPCIVTAEAGSVVRDGVEGFVVPARDSAAITATLDLLARDQKLRERMARAARARAESFTWNHYHAALIEVLEQIVGQRSASRRP
jgi:starch synthase